MRYFEVSFHITSPEQNFADSCDLVAAAAGEAGFETFEETADGLKGYVQTDSFDREALDTALQELPFADVKVDYDVKEAEYKDWNEEWEQEGFEPIVIGDGCIVHDGRHLPTTHAAVEIEIDARLAFGTGNHETTRMLAGRLMQMDLQGKSVLDAGCGTGILGIVALKRGASSVTGYDIDEWSADNARHNAVINHVDDNYTSLLGDATLLDSIAKKFDIVVANINRNILIADMPRFASVLTAGGTLLLSGFYTADINALRDEAANHGLTMSGNGNDGDWAYLAFTKR